MDDKGGSGRWFGLKGSVFFTAHEQCGELRVITMGDDGIDYRQLPRAVSRPMPS